MSSLKKPLLHHTQSSYGATTSSSSSPTLDRVPEERNEEVNVEEAQLDLEEQGYFIGSYKRFILFYSLVPLTSIIAFVLLAIPLILFIPHHHASNHFPSPLPELLTSAGLWSLSHLLRFPLFALTAGLISNPNAAILVHTTLHIILYNLLRLSILPILSIRQHMEFPLPTYADYAFIRIWWASLGWSLIEVGVAIWQGYEQVALYSEVMIPECRVEEMLYIGGDIDQELSVGGGSVRVESPNALQDAVQISLDHDLDRLVAIKSRQELEQVYGIPVIDIPVFITSLQRIDSIILSLGLTLLVSSSYLRSALSFSPSSPLAHDPLLSANTTFWITFSLVVLVHLALALLYTPMVLPRIGVHTAAYIGLLVGLGCLFAGLGVWGVLS